MSAAAVARRLAAAAGLLALLAGCALNGPVIQVTHYDLGAPAAPAAGAPGFGLRAVEVVAPSWLDGPAIQYRLAYASGSERHSYAESRWVASPAELLELALERVIASNGGTALSGGCRLRVDLDEFIHSFEGPAASHGQLEARAAVLAPRSDTLLARRSFSIGRPAPSHDARGAAEALGGAAGELTRALREWLATLDRDGAPGLNIARSCRGS